MQWASEQRDRRGRSLSYSVGGAGPWLLLPWCNVAWFDFSDLAALTRQHSVIVASPYGFGPSGRSPTAAYTADGLIDDLLHICDIVGADEFAVVGYSLTGAVAARLACTSPRVTAAVAGGFPLLGSYVAVRDEVEGLIDDAAVVAQVAEGFDPAAALAFYRALAELPDGDLVEQCPCPMMAFWGDRDAVLHGFNSAGDLVRELHARGVAVETISGLGHDDVLLHLDEIFGVASQWLVGRDQEPG